MTNVPPFKKRPHRLSKIDFLAYEGAELLCKRIEDVWARAGHPYVRAVPCEIRLGREVVWGVTIENMRNGMPIFRRKD